MSTPNASILDASPVLLRRKIFTTCFWGFKQLGQFTQSKKSSFSSLSNESLCKLRDEIAALLNSRSQNLQRELDQLKGSPLVRHSRSNGTTRPPKTQHKTEDRTATLGREGDEPPMAASAIKEGKKVEDFLIADALT
jgi:hypothetical protein